MNDRDKTIHELTRLVHWACTQHQLDGRVVTRAAEVLADDLSVMIGARDEPEVARFHQTTLAVLRAPEATVWRGGPARTDRASAAVANALAGSWLELDEGYRPVACHGGLYVLPALLAEAEATGLRCDAVLRSLVIAYELVTRIARAWTQRDLTMQAHGRYAAVGAAAGLALARGLDPEQMLAALGAAVTLIGPAPRNHLQEGVLIRNAWAASGACQGFLALEWSRCGITGSAGAFFDVYSTVLGGTVDADRLTQGLGEGWAIMDGYTKGNAEQAIDFRHPVAMAVERAESWLISAPTRDFRSNFISSQTLSGRIAGHWPALRPLWADLPIQCSSRQIDVGQSERDE